MKNEGTRLLIENFTLGVTNGDSTSSSKAYLARVIGYMVIPSILFSESSIASTAVLGFVILFCPLLLFIIFQNFLYNHSLFLRRIPMQAYRYTSIRDPFSYSDSYNILSKPVCKNSSRSWLYS